MPIRPGSGSTTLFTIGAFFVYSETSVADQLPQEGGQAPVGRGAVQPAAAGHPRPSGRPQADPRPRTGPQAARG